MAGSMVEKAVGWDRTGEGGGPAPGPGWQMNPGCRPDGEAGVSVAGGAVRQEKDVSESC